MIRMDEGDQALDEIKRLVPILGKQKAVMLETAYLLWDQDGRKRILEIVDAIKASAFSDEDLKESVLIEPPEKEIAVNGDFQLGTILYGKKPMYPLFLNKKDLLTHIGIFGSSGCGKTNVIHWLINALSNQDIPILIFDFSKRNYRDLLTVSGLKDRIKLYTVGRDVLLFRFNPLKPPEGVQISQWAKEFSEIFDHAYWLMGGGRHIILKALDGIYKKFNPSYPRISDLRDWLEKYGHYITSPREKNWLATAKRPLESLCFRETGNIFDSEDGIKPSDFFQPGNITVLELDSLSTDDKTFFIEIILQWIRDWLLVSGTREKLVGVIVLEEAHHVLNREKSKKFGTETVTDLIFREIRELGVGMIYADQHPSLVSYPALGNTSTHIYMNLGLDTKHSSDIMDAGNMLGLERTEEVSYLRRLPVGHGFILLRKSIFPNPFLIGFPLVIPKRGSVTDDNLGEIFKDRIMEEIKAKKNVPRDLPEDPKKLAELVQIEARAAKINSVGWKIVEVLAGAGGSSTSEIYKTLKMSCKVFNKQVKDLIDKGFVAAKKAKVYRQNAIYYFLTHDGEMAYALKRGKFSEGEVSEITDSMKRFVLQHFTLKEWAVVSPESKDHFVLEKSGKRIVVNLENELNRGKIYKDIDKAAGDDMYFVCTSERIKNKVIQQAARYGFDHRGFNLVVFVATFDELNGGKDLKKVEFNSG